RFSRDWSSDVCSSDLPVELEEAAAIDGTARLGTFLRIALPVARNGVATTGTIVFLLAWGEFLYAVNFFLSPGTYPLSALLAQQRSEERRVGKACTSRY